MSLKDPMGNQGRDLLELKKKVSVSYYYQLILRSDPPKTLLLLLLLFCLKYIEKNKL